MSIDTMLEVFPHSKEIITYRDATREEVCKVVKEIYKKDWRILKALARQE